MMPASFQRLDVCSIAIIKIHQPFHMQRSAELPDLAALSALAQAWHDNISFRSFFRQHIDNTYNGHLHESISTRDIENAYTVMPRMDLHLPSTTPYT